MSQFASVMNVLVSTIVLSLVLNISGRPEETTYSTKYDKINIDQILKNDRILNTYIKCLLDQDTCKTNESKYLKGILIKNF